MTDPDDEWEYEYDENETEDFYIPIDLSDVPSAQVPVNAERRPGHPTLLKSRLRALNAARGQLLEPSLDATTAQGNSTMGELQLTSLHTSNPLIMYNEQLLSCHWASTVGTDMYFTKPQATEEKLNASLRSLPAVDLLSLGTAKLVARVGRLRPRDDLFDSGIDNGDKTQVAAVNEDETAVTREAVTITTEQDKDTVPTPALSSAKPASFLAKLNEVKARRGENSRLSLMRTPEGTRLVTEHADFDTQPEETGPSQSRGDAIMGGT